MGFEPAQDFQPADLRQQQVEQDEDRHGLARLPAGDVGQRLLAVAGILNGVEHLPPGESAFSQVEVGVPVFHD